MEWLIVSLLVISGIIYLFMRKLDQMLEPHKGKAELYPSANPYVLILGETPLAASLMRLLESQDIEYLQIKDENNLDCSKHYQILFAVSNDDLSNLLTCIIVSQKMKHCRIIAVCNLLQNRMLFEQNHIPYRMAFDTTADALIRGTAPS